MDGETQALIYRERERYAVEDRVEGKPAWCSNATWARIREADEAMVRVWQVSEQDRQADEREQGQDRAVRQGEQSRE